MSATGAAVAFAAVPAGAAQDAGTIVALYKRPADPAAFDSYYATKHAPLAKTLPGLTSYTISKQLGPSDPYYLVAILTFPSVDAMKAALSSSQGTAVVADLKNFAQAGVDILTFDAVPV
ncbi:MAG: EthD family reductase [Vulcanimicrobiaceae bacterium]